MGSIIVGKFGKKAPKIDKRTLMLEKYMTPSLPRAPRVYDTDKAHTLIPERGWGMYLNDQLGDCTCAGAAHMVNWWTATAQGKVAKPTDADVLKAYIAVSGYDPKTGQNDNGAFLLDVLNYWRKNGIGGHKIDAFGIVDPKNRERVMDACWLFGGLYMGLWLPAAINNMGDRWDIPEGQALTGEWEPGSAGGHCVPVIAYDYGVQAVITWGSRIKMTWRFFFAYCDECYGVLAKDWMEANGKSFTGFDYAALQNDLKLL